jgi:uncharacterized membrane protein
MALDTPGPAAEAAPIAAAAEAPEPAEPGKRRKLPYATIPGCWGALIFACLSFTPSLLPGEVLACWAGAAGRASGRRTMRR